MENSNNIVIGQIAFNKIIANTIYYRMNISGLFSGILVSLYLISAYICINSELHIIDKGLIIAVISILVIYEIIQIYHKYINMLEYAEYFTSNVVDYPQYQVSKDTWKNRLKTFLILSDYYITSDVYLVSCCNGYVLGS